MDAQPLCHLCIKVQGIVTNQISGRGDRVCIEQVGVESSESSILTYLTHQLVHRYFSIYLSQILCGNGSSYISRKASEKTFAMQYEAPE